MIVYGKRWQDPEHFAARLLSGNPTLFFCVFLLDEVLLVPLGS